VGQRNPPSPARGLWRAASADQGFAKGGTIASAQSASLNGGLGEEPPAGSRGRATGWGQGQWPTEAESFLSTFIQKGAKS